MYIYITKQTEKKRGNNTGKKHELKEYLFNSRLQLSSYWTR